MQNKILNQAKMFLYLILLCSFNLLANCNIVNIDDLNFGDISINNLKTNQKIITTTSNLKISCNNPYKTFICLNIGGKRDLNNKLVRFNLALDNNFNYLLNNEVSNYYQAEVLSNQSHNLIIYAKAIIAKNAAAGLYQGQITGFDLNLFTKEAANMEEKHPGCGALLNNRQNVSNIINLKANVLAECMFESVGELNFGTATKLENISSQTNISLKCTNNTNYKLSIDGGKNLKNATRFMQNQYGNYVEYHIFQDIERIIPWQINKNYEFMSSEQNLAIFGFIPKQNKVKVGDYQDVLKLNLSF